MRAPIAPAHVLSHFGACQGRFRRRPACMSAGGGLGTAGAGGRWHRVRHAPGRGRTWCRGAWRGAGREGGRTASQVAGFKVRAVATQIFLPQPAGCTRRLLHASDCVASLFSEPWAAARPSGRRQARRQGRGAQGCAGVVGGGRDHARPWCQCSIPGCRQGHSQSERGNAAGAGSGAPAAARLDLGEGACCGAAVPAGRCGAADAGLASTPASLGRLVGGLPLWPPATLAASLPARSYVSAALVVVHT